MKEVISKIKKISFLVISVLILIFLYLLINLLVETNRERNLIDTSFLSDQPCQAPCWYGLYPGISTESDIERVLSGLDFLDFGSFQKISGVLWEGVNPYAISVDYAGHSLGECAFLIVDDDVLQVLKVNVKFDLTLSTVIEKIGPPEFVDYYQMSFPKERYEISFYWPNHQIIMIAVVSNSRFMDSLVNGASIPGKLKISEIEYTVKKGFNLPSPGVRFTWPGIAE